MRRRRSSEKREWFDLRGPGGRLVLKVVGVGIAAFALGYLLVALLFFPGWGRDAIVSVPDLRGRTLPAAERLAGAAGLEVERGSALAHPTVPEGAVLAQTPLPGQEVTRGAEVTVIVSTGPERRPVPDVTQLSGEQAVRLLRQTGFSIRIRRVPGEQPAGRVLGVTPTAGTPVAIPGTVELTLSAGPPLVAVPPLAGLTEQGARQALEAAGLRLSVVEHDPFSFAPAGEVLEQAPAAGTQVRAGSGVRVVVAGEPPAVEEPEMEPAEGEPAGPPVSPPAGRD